MSKDAMQKTIALQLYERMKAGEKWRPVRWGQSNMLRDGYCFVEGATYTEHTPRTVGVSVSPAFAGVQRAVERYGDVWERVE